MESRNYASDPEKLIAIVCVFPRDIKVNLNTARTKSQANANATQATYKVRYKNKPSKRKPLTIKALYF